METRLHGEIPVICFSSFTKIGWTNGREIEYPDTVPFGKSRSLQWGPELPGGIIIISYENTAIDRIVVGDVHTRLWLLNYDDCRLHPILETDRPSKFVTCAASLPERKAVIVTAIVDGEQRLYVAPLDGGSPEPLTSRGDGFFYGVDVSPNGESLVCHVTKGKHSDAPQSYPPYSIVSIDLRTGERRLIAGDDEHLYFGPKYSPDGTHIAFLDCRYREDPAHFWSDICVTSLQSGKPATLTQGQAHWFGTSFGPAAHRGGGSNFPAWIDDRKVIFARKLPHSHPDCRYDPVRQDHQELVFDPAAARGGAHLCTVDRTTGLVTDLTEPVDGLWDFRPTISPDGHDIVFCRARVGEPSGVWWMAAEGGPEMKLTDGFAGHGADHPRWIAPESARCLLRLA